MSEAIRTYADTNRTDHPLIMAFIRARRFNLLSGGAVVAPWDLEPGHTVEEWNDASRALDDVPNIKGRQIAQEAWIQKFRQENAERNKRIH